MLEIKQVGKAFAFGRGRSIEVLRDISLTLPPAGSVAVTGNSGSGKTTLLNIIGGLMRPDTGEVLWQGRSVYDAPGRWRGATVGFIFQSYCLMPELSVLENVLLPAAFRRQDRRREALELIEQVGLTDRLAHRPAELSGGEQQRAAIARALINDPALILADEPTGNLDADTGEKVLNLLLALVAKKNKALVLVTHDQNIARRTDRRRHLVNGKLENNE